MSNLWWNQHKASQSSKTSRGSRGSRTSHMSGVSIRGSQPRELEFQFFIRQTETLYPPWWTREGAIEWFRDLPDDTMWNCYICGFVLLGVVYTVATMESIYIDIIDVIYNISYAIHMFAIGYKIVTELENTDITFWVVLGFLVDIGTFAHYVQSHNPGFKLGAYYIRLHRPYKYLGSLSDYNLKGSVMGTTLKYCYIFIVMRITWAYVWLHVATLEAQYYKEGRLSQAPPTLQKRSGPLEENQGSEFLAAVYIISKMFIPIGPSIFPNNDVQRIVCILIMMTGCLVVTGAAVASMSLIISLYMRPEETFRSRYRLIMKEMSDTRVPPALRDKVETFYKMYWHKQRAVSETQLLPTFPPTLPTTINIDIYFEATQKARILRELSYQLLSELAKKMQTIHYIPGDAIIKRGSKKCKIIYITYGDVEMLTAEDDNTAILRLTRGTVLTPCGGAAAAALGVSHLAVRAATFCTAHVLKASELWRVVYKHSVSQDHAGPILASFTDHVERVKRHYCTKIPDEATHKSSILQFNRNLMALKGMKDANGVPVLASGDIFLEVAGCYIMRNRPDATLTDQSDEICLRPKFPCILQPTSSLLVVWNGFVAFIILICCITHPYNLVFEKEAPLEFRFFDQAVTVVFILDHIVYLSTGANVEEGVPITFAQTSSQQMRSHWFVLDVVATLPVFEFIDDGHFGGINKLLRLPKLFRVLKSLEESCVYRSNVLRFLSYTLLLLIACYLIAAMQQAFMCFQAGYCLVTNFTHTPFWEQKPLDSETINSRLIFGLYWAISMINFTNHRQTWGADDWKHVLYTLVILEICIVLRIFMEAVYSATIMVTTAPREDYGSRIEMVKNFLIRNEVDPQLMKRFINYLQLCWHTDKAYKITHKQHSNIFYDLPEHVFQDIVGRNRNKYILVIPFMKLIKKEDLKYVTAAVKLFYCSPNEILLNTGELTNEIYIIKQGICEIIDPNSQKSIGELTSKNHFGGLICLLRLPAFYTIRAVTHVQVMSVPRKALQKGLNSPQLTQAIKYLKTTPEFQRLQTPIPSFIKYVPPPPTSNLMHFRLPRKHEPDSEFLNPFDRLGFLSILRYVFPRYTIRPDGKYLLRYEWFRFICALCSAQLFPHYTYLVLQWPLLYHITLFLDLSAFYDIFQRMLIGYFNEDGILVYHPSSTSSYYMRGSFIADLFGCLPLENLETARTDVLENRFRVSPVKQYLMLNRLIQLYRMPSAMMVLKDYIERRDILMVMQAIPLFMAMLNILTCFMVFYSAKIYYREIEDGYDWRIEPITDHGGSWLLLFKDTFRFNLTSTPWNLHLATYFWVVYECSTTGYGVFNPSNHDLMKVLFVGMASSAMIITYYSVRIISVRANVNKSLAGFQQHMKDINVYMVREKLDSELQKEIRRYYEYNWEKMGGIDYRGVLKMCDQITLRTDAILHIYGPTFAKCPLLVNADVSLLRIIGRAVRSVYFLRDMKILQHDDMATNMYFVDYGGVEVRVTTGEMNSILRLPRGSVFGNLEGTPCLRIPYNVVATSRLHLLMIKSLAFAHVTKDFPAIKELMAKSRAGTEKDKKMYILGSEATVKMRRHVPSGPPPRSKTNLLKYIYFQEGMVQHYLLCVSMGCIYLDLYNAGYQDNAPWILITLYSLDFCFLLKIFTQHALPFLVTSKSMKRIMMPIRRLYFKGEFRYDLISVLPMELFSFAASEEDDWMWFGLLRLNRVFRIATVHKCIRMRNESITVNLTLTTVMAVSIWFTLFVHSTTCIWYFMAVVEDQLHPNSSWIHLDDGTTHCDNYYICSLYFVITTFTQNGVGDIMPKKHSEVLFVAILQILSTMIFMVYVGEFSNIIQYQSYRSFSFYSKYLELQEFLKNNRVSQNLVTIVNKYTLHLWRENRGLQIPHFLKHAPLSLRLRLMSAAYLHHITRHHIFEECEPAFLRQMVGCLKLYTYNADMYVVKESEITDAMYVIHTGKVKETCEEMDISARVYPAGSYFGILQGLLRNTPYTHSYQTMCKSQVLTLKLDDWEYLLTHFPDSRDAIHKHMRQVGDKDMDQSNWPGGAPVDKAPEFAPLSEIQDLPDTGMSQFPGFQRHFGRVSTADGDEPYVPSTMRRQSRYFAWPTDSREPDALPVARQEHEEERGVDQITIEQKPQHGFFGKFVSTAKKLMGRVSDPEALSALAADGRDELLLEEDAEATEALLAQFEKAKKQEMDEKKKMRQKSTFQAEEEQHEKHLLTLDMTESTTTLGGESEIFTMRPLRIRDDEEEEEETTTKSDVLNLGRRKPKVESDISEVEITVDMLNEVPVDEVYEGDNSETLQLALTRPTRLEPADEVVSETFDTQDGKDIQDTQSAQDATEKPIILPLKLLSEEKQKLEVDTTEPAADVPLVPMTTLKLASPSESSSESSKSEIVAIAGTNTQPESETQSAEDLTVVLSVTDVIHESSAAKAVQNIVQDIIDSTQPAEDTIDNKPVVDTTDIKPAEGTTDIKPLRDTPDIKPVKDATDKRLAEDTTDKRLAEDTTDIKPAEDTIDKRLAEDTTDIKPAEDITDIKPAEDTIDRRLADDTTDIKPAEVITDIKPAEVITDIKVAEDTRDIKVAEDTTDERLAEDTTDIKPAKDTTDIKPAEDTTDIRPSEDTIDIKPSEDITDIKPSEGIRDIQPIHDVSEKSIYIPPFKLASDVKTESKISQTESAASIPTLSQTDQATKDSHRNKKVEESYFDIDKKEIVSRTSRFVSVDNLDSDIIITKPPEVTKPPEAPTPPADPGTSFAPDTPDTQSKDTEEKTAFAIQAARKASFVKRKIIFDPGHENLEVGPSSLPEADEELTFAEDNKEEGTNTKMNRRFVHVRYDEGKDEEGSFGSEDELVERNEQLDPVKHITLDSDEPVPGYRSTGESNEGDDEATSTSTSTSGSPHKPKPYFRRDSGD